MAKHAFSCLLEFEADWLLLHKYTNTDGCTDKIFRFSGVCFFCKRCSCRQVRFFAIASTIDNYREFAVVFLLLGCLLENVNRELTSTIDGSHGEMRRIRLQNSPVLLYELWIVNTMYVYFQLYCLFLFYFISWFLIFWKYFCFYKFSFKSHSVVYFFLSLSGSCMQYMIFNAIIFTIPPSGKPKKSANG